MFFRNPPFKLSAMADAASAGIGGTFVAGGDSVATAAPGSEFRAPVATREVFRRLAPLHHGVLSLIALLRRIIYAVLRKVGDAFGVKVDMPADQTSNASMVASPGDAQGQQRVEQAAAAAGAELSEFVKRLLSEQPDTDALSGPGAATYASTALGEMGEAMRSMATQIQANETMAEAGIVQIASQLGTSKESVRALMESSSFPEDSAAFSTPSAKAALEAVASVERDRGQLCGLQLAFCNHAIAAIRASSVDAALSGTARGLIEKYANEDMAKTIFRVSDPKNGDKYDLSVVHSAKSSVQHSPMSRTEGDVNKEQDVAPVALVTKRRSRVGMQAGAEDTAVPPVPQVDDGIVESNRRERMRS